MTSGGIDPGELARRAAAGDIGAFDTLIDAHIAQVRRFARAFARSDADADDLAQEALVKVYRAIGSYRGGAAFTTWLFAIVRNACVDAGRSRAGQEQARTDALDGQRPADADAATTAEDLLVAAEERRAVWQALAGVPPEFRSALVLCDLEGLSYEEVAAVEAVALGTVKSRVSRGREHLRRLLAPRVASFGNGLADGTVSPAGERMRS